MKVEVLLPYILGNLCVSCNLVLLRYIGVYHCFRPLLVFVHVGSLLDQYRVELGFFYSTLRTQFDSIRDYLLREIVTMV